MQVIIPLTLNQQTMKQIILSIALLASVFIQHSFAQGSDSLNRSSELLSKYYELKDALAAGNSSLASSKAELFIGAVNTVDYKVISEGNVNALLKDATPISQSKDIKVQRDHFSSLSNNLIKLAKAVTLTADPVYQQYCPMKKANWLSNEQAIKNPYYGNAMLTCGSVVETIKK